MNFILQGGTSVFSQSRPVGSKRLIADEVWILMESVRMHNGHTLEAWVRREDFPDVVIPALGMQT